MPFFKIEGERREHCTCNIRRGLLNIAAHNKKMGQPMRPKREKKQTGGIECDCHMENCKLGFASNVSCKRCVYSIRREKSNREEIVR